MAIQKFDPNLLRRQYDDRLLRAWSAAEAAVAQKEQASAASRRRVNVRDEELTEKYPSLNPEGR